MKLRDPEQGFTLLELMISLAIMAMIALMIGSSLSSGTRILNRSTNYGVALVEALARRDLRTFVEAILTTVFPGSEQPLFSGDSTKFQFQAVVDDGTFWPGAPVFGDLARQRDGAIVLVVSGLSDEDQTDIRLQYALTGPEGQLELAYFGRQSPGENAKWHDAWSADQGLPSLVKLVLSEGDITLPPIVIRPAKRNLQSEMSLSSLVPPPTPSRP